MPLKLFLMLDILDFKLLWKLLSFLLVLYRTFDGIEPEGWMQAKLKAQFSLFD
jgi:hypothetical protein